MVTFFIKEGNNGMKKLFFNLVLFNLLCWTSDCFCQAGLEKLTADSIKSVTIISKFSLSSGSEKVVIDKYSIEKLLDFLKKIELTQCNVKNCKVDARKYLFYISFNGWREKIYLFDDVIFIAKSRYRIDKDITGKFAILFNSLSTGK